MEDQTIERIAALLSQMSPGSAPKWSPATTALYLAALGDIPDELAIRAVGHAIRTEEFRPSPATIRKIVADLCREDKPDPGTALAEVRQLVRQYGLNATPTDNPNIFSPGPPMFSSPEVEKTVLALGGWDTVNEYAPAMLTAHFQKIYKAISDGAGDDDLNVLRLEYREQRMTEAQNLVEHEEAVIPEAMRLPEPQEAKKVLEKVGAGVKGL